MKKTIIILLILSVVGASLAGRTYFMNNSHDKPVFEIPAEIVLDSIYTEILNLRLDHPNIVFSQVLLETGNLTSSLYKTNKNLFGMKVSGSRATTSLKVMNGYKWYPNWRESLLDYSLLQMSFYRNKTEEEYLKQLSKVYAQDSKYIDKLREIKQQLVY